MHAVARLADFLGIVGMIALLLGGIGVASGVNAFVARKVDVYAGVKQRAEDAIARVPGAHLLPGQFMAIRQAIGMSKGRAAGLAEQRPIRVLESTGIFWAAFEQRALLPAWRFATTTLPQWLGEQLECVERGAVSVQTLASVLAASAVLLAWLM